MPVTAAIDNETLDHLLSVVERCPSLGGIRALSKSPASGPCSLRRQKTLSGNECFGETVANASAARQRAPASSTLSGNPQTQDQVGLQQRFRVLSRRVANRPSNGASHRARRSRFDGPEKPVFSPIPPSRPGIKNPLTAPYEG